MGDRFLATQEGRNNASKKAPPAPKRALTTRREKNAVGQLCLTQEEADWRIDIVFVSEGASFKFFFFLIPPARRKPSRLSGSRITLHRRKKRELPFRCRRAIKTKKHYCTGCSGQPSSRRTCPHLALHPHPPAGRQLQHLAEPFAATSPPNFSPTDNAASTKTLPPSFSRLAELEAVFSVWPSCLISCLVPFLYSIASPLCLAFYFILFRPQFRSALQGPDRTQGTETQSLVPEPFPTPHLPFADNITPESCQVCSCGQCFALRPFERQLFRLSAASFAHSGPRLSAALPGVTLICRASQPHSSPVPVQFAQSCD